MKIIAFAGRSKSGKYEIASVCAENGFKIVRFAFALKKLISDIVGFEVNENQETKDKEVNLVLSDKDLKFISNETDIDIEDVESVLKGVKFERIRDMLQIIGTDLIRKYKPNWHVDKLRNLILEDVKSNYVIDDMRFPNEKQMVEDLGGECWFIIRPSNLNVSNHLSETSLIWQNFGDKVIVNDEKLSSFKLRWAYFLNFSILTNEKFSYEMLGCSDYNELRKYLCFSFSKCNNEEDIKIEKEYMRLKHNVTDSYIDISIRNLYVPIEMYCYFNMEKPNISKIDKDTLKYEKGSLTYKQKRKKERIEITSNPFMIEDLKFEL